MQEAPVNYFAFHVAVLRFIGINLRPIQHPLWSKLYKMYAIFIFSVSFVLYTLLETGALYMYRNDIQILTFILCYWISHVMGLVKATLMIVRRVNLRKYMDILEDGVFKPNVGRGGTKEIEIVKNAVWTARIQACFYFSMAIIIIANTLISVARNPTIERIISDANTHTKTNLTEIIRKLPWNVWFWFDTTSTPNYEIAVTYQIWCVYTFALLTGAIDTLLAGMMVHLNAQFRILGNAMESVVDRANTQTNLQDFHANLFVEMSDCLDYHNQLLDLSANMENDLNLLILGQFFVSTLLFCFQLFQLSNVALFSPQFVSMSCYLFLMLFQLGIFCYNGNEITIQSELVATAVYSSHWFHTNNAFKKSLVLVMVRAQRPVRLSAGKFAFLSMETLMNIIRGSVSYYMVLHQTSG